MSINDFLNKIKGKIGIDNTTFLCLCAIVLVGFASFGLGRLSVVNINDNYNSELENSNLNIVKAGVGNSIKVESSMQNIGGLESSIKNVENIPKEKLYVASKNGKLYYTATCRGAKRIATKNEVWFASSDDAKKAGFAPSPSCK